MTEYTNTNQNAAMDWDDAIENDGREFIILPEGDYNFTVTGFERGRFPGSAKMSACNKAALTLQVQTDNGVAIIHTDLILNRLLEWKISAFFRCIGQKKHCERLVMDWNRVTGSRGAPTSSRVHGRIVTATRAKQTTWTDSSTTTRSSSPKRTSG